MIRTGHLCRRYGRSDILSDVSLEIRKGEVFTLIGPSGSGKTTFLRLIDLLDTPTSGKIFFDGQEVPASEAGRLAIRRRMGMVFQKPAVLNTTVAENVAFGLKFRGVPREDAGRKVRETLEIVGLPDYIGRRAVTLSGGEMQRVAIARAIVTEPDVLLLDEPTANLDPVSSEVIENLILRINREFRTTIILSTHDMIQGQRLADRIGVIMEGRIVQDGTATEIFYHPQGRDIARFVGTNTVLKGTVTANEGGHATIAIGDTVFEALTPLSTGTVVALYIRPEEVTLASATAMQLKTSVRNHLTGKITRMVPYGPFIRITADCGMPLEALITRRSCNELGFTVGADVVAGVKATAIHVLPDENRP